MRIRGVVAALAVLPLVAGCEADFAAPRTAAECFAEASDSGGHHFSDGISGWNVAYSEKARPLGSSLTVYVCAPKDSPATVSVDAPPGVEVDPDPLEVSGDVDEVGELRLTVTAEMQETVYVSFRDESAGGGSTAVEIDADGDEWSLHPR